MREVTLIESYRRRQRVTARAATLSRPDASLAVRNAALLGLLATLYGAAFLARSAQILPW